MIINSLKIYNFFTFEKVDISLGEDLFFITGLNKDENLSESNGAGKSLFCQSIVWALFDDILREGMLKDDVIGPKDEYCKVVLEVENNGDHFVIDRVRNHPDRGNDVIFLKNGDSLTGHSTSQTNEKIEIELGINKKTVYHCGYFDADKPTLSSLTPSKLLSTISEMIGLDLDEIDKCITNTKKLAKELDSDIKNKSEKLSIYESNIEKLEADIEFLNKNYEEFEDRKKQDIASIISRRGQIELEMEEIEEILSKKSSIEEKYEIAKANIADLETLNGKTKKLEKKLNTALKKRDSLIEDMTNLKVTHSDLQKSYDNLTKNPSGHCVYCGNILNESLTIDNKRAELSSNLEQVNVEKLLKQVDIDQVESDIASFEHEIAECKKIIEDAQEEYRIYHKYENKIESLKQVEKMKNSHLKTLENLDKEKKNIQNREPSSIIETLEEKTSLLESTNELVFKLTVEVDNMREERRLCDILKKSLETVKESLFNGFVIDLETEISAMLDELTEGDITCDLSEKKGQLYLSFCLSTDNKMRHYKSFSRGERSKIDTAVSNALNNLLNVGFLINDEPFSGLDSVGIPHLLNFYSRHASNKTFLFVGHQIEMKDYFNNSKSLVVIKENGVSRVEVN